MNMDLMDLMFDCSRYEIAYEDMKLVAQKRGKEIARLNGIIHELRQKLAKSAVDKIDAQALKSAEHALIEKDEVIEDLSEEIARLYKKVHGDPILNLKKEKEEKKRESNDRDYLVSDEIDEAVKECFSKFI